MSVQLCSKCGLYVVYQDDLCEECLDLEESIGYSLDDVDLRMRAGEGKRIEEGFYLLNS